MMVGDLNSIEVGALLASKYVYKSHIKQYVTPIITKGGA